MHSAHVCRQALENVLGASEREVAQCHGEFGIGQLGLGWLDRGRTTWHKIKTYPNNIELEVEATFDGGEGGWSGGTHCAIVEVDAETGIVKVERYVAVEDCGALINPAVVEGQIRGGVVQGIGTALYEEIPYDETGQPLAGTLADYLLPGAAEMPAIKIGHLHTPTPHTEYGMKGMGEGGAVAPPAAIANAVRDALVSTGAEVNETPITPRRVMAAIRKAGEAAPKP